MRSIKKNKYVIVTGSESQMGFHLCKKLIKENYKVIKIDKNEKKIIFIMLILQKKLK